VVIESRYVKISTVMKDMLLFLGGLAGIAWQQKTNTVSWELLIVYTLMVSGAGLSHFPVLLAKARGLLTEPSPQSVPSQRQDTDSHSSQNAQSNG
jgi:hypothetical protein